LHAFVDLDRAALHWFESQRTATRTVIALAVTTLGSDVVTLGIVGIVAMSIRKLSRYWMNRLLVTVSSGLVLNEILKFIFYRKRPEFSHPLLHLYTNSFPSGHAQAATVLYGTLIILTISLAESRVLRIAVIPFGIIMIFLISVSRLYLGVHYLSDVIGGVLEGIAWVNAVGIFFDR